MASQLQDAKEKGQQEQTNGEPLQPDRESDEPVSLHVKLFRKAFLLRHDPDKISCLRFQAFSRLCA